MKNPGRRIQEQLHADRTKYHDPQQKQSLWIFLIVIIILAVSLLFIDPDFDLNTYIFGKSEHTIRSEAMLAQLNNLLWYWQEVDPEQEYLIVHLKQDAEQHLREHLEQMNSPNHPSTNDKYLKYLQKSYSQLNANKHQPNTATKYTQLRLTYDEDNGKGSLLFDRKAVRDLNGQERQFFIMIIQNEFI